MNNTFFWVIGLLLILSACGASKNSAIHTSRLQTYRFAQLDSLMEREQRPVAVLFRTDWCRYCKSMEQTTFQNREVVAQLNQDFYFISFDAEQREAVNFKGHRFAYQPSGRNSGTHELALSLASMEGQLSYPAFVILNPAYEIVFQYNAYLSVGEMQLVLEQVVSTFLPILSGD